MSEIPEAIERETLEVRLLIELPNKRFGIVQQFIVPDGPGLTHGTAATVLANGILNEFRRDLERELETIIRAKAR